MPTIAITINSNIRFRYLWLKYVTGVNLHRHCANALKGQYSEKVKPQRPSPFVVKLDEFDADVFYLCGVSQPYVWANNFHLAFEKAEGEQIAISRNGIGVTGANVREIVIRPEFTETPHSHLREFNTCRNWLFANQNQERFNR